MPKPIISVSALLSLLVLAGCQSQPSVPLCEPPPPPPAWMMQKREPNLTPRLLNELSPSPPTATRPFTP